MSILFNKLKKKMNRKSLALINGGMPSVFDNLFTPWDEWFGNDSFLTNRINIPAVNITENNDSYNVSLAVPGYKKDDFKIAVDGNMLTISSEKEQNQNETNKKFTRKEYSYSSFSRSFTLPNEINTDVIDAKYEDGVLSIILPRKVEAQKTVAKMVVVN